MSGSVNPIDADDYYPSMSKVYEYIDDNIAEELSLGTLSEVAGYSEYHFHRIFHAITGKTPHEYVLFRRVRLAAGRLLYDRGSITQIALDCGFSSSSSFVRCFRKQMGCAPSVYRKYKERRRPPDPKDGFKKYLPNAEYDSLFSEISLPDLRVAGIASKGLSRDFRSAEIEKSFKKLFAWLLKSNLIVENMPVMGITLDTPEVLSLSECRYFACVPADETFEPEGEISVRTFRTAGRYVKFSLDRERTDFAETFFEIVDYLYGCHMPDKGYYPDDRPFVEFYAQKGPETVISFCVPVR